MLIGRCLNDYSQVLDSCKFLLDINTMLQAVISLDSAVSPNEIKTIFRAIVKNNAKYLPRFKNSSSSNIFPSKKVNHFNQHQIVH